MGTDDGVSVSVLPAPEGDRQTKITKESEKRPPELHRMRCKCSDERPEVKFHAGLNSVVSIRCEFLHICCGLRGIRCKFLHICCKLRGIRCAPLWISPSPLKTHAALRRDAPSAALCGALALAAAAGWFCTDTAPVRNASILKIALFL